MPQNKRLFVAGILPPALMQNLFLIQNHIVARLSDVELKMVPRDNFHVTLEFLGPTKPRDESEIVGAIMSITSSHKPLRLTLKGISIYLANLMLEFETTDEYSSLVQKIRERINEETSLSLIQRDIPPHITIARLINDKEIQTNGLNIEIPTVEIKEIGLYSSTLNNGAPPSYELIHSSRLGEG